MRQPPAILDMGVVHIPSGHHKINICFPDSLETDQYGVILQMMNKKDANPQHFSSMIVVAKNNYGMMVELSYPVDSPNYELSYIIIDHQPVKGPGPLPFRKLAPEELQQPTWDMKDIKPWPKNLACNHKWKRYTGLMDSFDYCEICDEKKR